MVSLEILTSTQRWGALAVAAGMACILILLRGKFRRSSVVPTLCILGLACSLCVLWGNWLIGQSLTDGLAAKDHFNERRWVSLAPYSAIGFATGTIVGVVILVLASFANRGIVSPWRRALLFTLRTLSVLFALLLFWEPALELRQVTHNRNHVAVVVDTSQSMALQDGAGNPSRLQHAKNLIEHSQATLEQWNQTRNLDFFTFSNKLLPTNAEELRGNTILAKGNATRILASLQEIETRYQTSELAGVVILSDGTATGALRHDLPTATRFLRSMQVPVHTAWIGDAGLKDRSIARVLADEFAFVRTVVKIDVVLSATGYPQQHIPVTLSKDGVALQSKSVAIADSSTEAKTATTSFEFTPDRVGKYVYEISIPQEETEASHTNNSRTVILRVIRDKIRVLLVAGQPSWDVHALRRMLKHNPNVDLISFFILRTMDDINIASRSEMSLIPFPTRELFEEQLPSFDVVVLQNFAYAPYGIGRYLENIRNYVHQGGALAVVGGENSFSSGKYARTPLAKVLPISLSTTEDRIHHHIDTSEFRPILTRSGASHPITNMGKGHRSAVKEWAKLPTLIGINRVEDAKPGANVLATHPTHRTSSGKSMPVIALGDYGKGRCLAIMTDSLWRWGFVAAAIAGNSGRYFDDIWEHAIRWLIHDPQYHRLHIAMSAMEYLPQEEARIDVKLYQPNYVPAAGEKVHLQISKQENKVDQKPTEATIALDDQGNGSFSFKTQAWGVYQVEASAQINGTTEHAQELFVVREANIELDTSVAKPNILQHISQQTQGTFLDNPPHLPADLHFEPTKVQRVDQVAQIELWSHLMVLLLILFLLGFEWVLRQRSGNGDSVKL